MIERWWRTGEVHPEKPTVVAERNNVMHYFLIVIILYEQVNELAGDLKILRKSLKEIAADRIMREHLFPIERQLICFGFHLAKLDL